MGAILAFFARFHRFLFFVLLEIISLYLVVKYNRDQGMAFFSTANEVTGRINGVVSQVYGYLHLQAANDSLMAENARLRQKLQESFYADTVKPQQVTDTLLKQKYSFIPGHVVKNSIHQRNNFLTLDVGSKHGIREHMGVIGPSGIVGITRQVTRNYTAVLSILHKDFKVSAEVVETNEVGSVEWDGKNPEYVIMRDVPIHAKLEKGQHVVTSNYSSAFPRGTRIGTIENFEIKPGDSYYSINVKLSTNLRNIRQAYVVYNLFKEQQDSLEAVVPDTN